MNREQRRKAKKKQQKEETRLRLLGMKRIKDKKYFKHLPDSLAKDIVQKIINKISYW